ncbi:MAG TPA: PIN domain-containing protein [Chthonomonadaceae bacterium]|nr:PIN domain-containing protein [Chthonomonadaceae bacterium]
MESKPKLFWDSSGLLAAVMSPDAMSASRQLLRLGEVGAVDMRASREVLRDIETLVRKRKAALLPQLAQILDRANIAITLDPNQETVDRCIEMTGYLPDARVLAAAVECDADLFLTFDTEHFLQNPLIGPPDTRLRVVTPKQALDWCRIHFEAKDKETNE